MMKKTTQTDLQKPRKLGRLFKKETGASAIEYAIIAGLIAVVIIGGATAIGTDVNDLFNEIADTLGGGGDTTTPTPES